MENTEKLSLLVTGASGFIGGRLIGGIANRCRSVVSMYRHRIPEPVANVFPVCSDLRTIELLGSPLRGVDTVVHLAWEDEFEARSHRDKSINLLLLKNLIYKMQEAGTRRLILLSHVGASALSKEVFLKDKYLMEQTAINSEIPQVTIIRSPMVMSGVIGEDKYLGALLNLLRFPLVYPLPVGKDKKFDIVSLNDLVEVLGDEIFRLEDESRSMVELKSTNKYSMDQLMGYISKKYTKSHRLGLGTFAGRNLAKLFDRFYAKSKFSMSTMSESGLLNGSPDLDSNRKTLFPKGKSLEEILYH